MSFLRKYAFYYRGYCQGAFFLGLAIYTWCFPPSARFEESILDGIFDLLGAGALILGGALRVWGVSHAGKSTRSRRLKAPFLRTTGPYAVVRHPIYCGNFFIGLGMVILSDALLFIALFVILFGWYYHILVDCEEEFLQEQFGMEYERYRQAVPKYIPMAVPLPVGLLGNCFPLKELGTLFGIMVGASFYEWIESPVHQGWIMGLLHHLMVLL